MKHEASRELFSYWNRLRGERSAPERSEIDPAALRKHLADTFMLEIDANQQFPFRLSGTRVNGLFQGEQKTRSFIELWRPEERRNLAAVLLTVADGACPVVAGSKGAPTGHADCAIEFLFLPLRHFGKTHARLLGMVTLSSQPAWLGMLPLGPLSLRSLRVIDDPDPFIAPRSARSRTTFDLPESSQPLRPAPMVERDEVGLFGATPAGTLRRARPTLQVIEGGRT